MNSNPIKMIANSNSFFPPLFIFFGLLSNTHTHIAKFIVKKNLISSMNERSWLYSSLYFSLIIVKWKIVWVKKTRRHTDTDTDTMYQAMSDMFDCCSSMNRMQTISIRRFNHLIHSYSNETNRKWECINSTEAATKILLTVCEKNLYIIFHILTV